MPQIMITKQKNTKQDGRVLQKSMAFLYKLTASDETPGLHIEPMKNAADPRARTGRVDQGLRAVLYRIDTPGEETLYIYDGTYEHDEAILRARTRVLRVNPVNGIPEIIERTMPDATPAGPEQEWAFGAPANDLHQPVEPPAAESEAASALAEQPATEAAEPAGLPVASSGTKPAMPFLGRKGYTIRDLVGKLGFEPSTARLLCSFRTEAALLAHVDSFPNEWQVSAVLGLADGSPISAILDSIGADRTGDSTDPAEAGQSKGDEARAETPAAEPVAAAAEENEVAPPAPISATADDALLRAKLSEPAARAQFTFVEDDEELRRVIEGGDFGQWRVFLHPEQRKFASNDFNGAFRLTGGAGTGKTVVLLHRARRLARANPNARIILTTFTRSLASDLERNLERLDPSLPRAKELGDPGILVLGIDQLAAAVRKADRDAFGQAAEAIFGATIDARTPDPNDKWADAIDDAGAELPDALRSASFFDGEYVQVVLPQRVNARDVYFRAKRPGRGVALDRRRRAAVWTVIERYRLAARHDNTMTFPEVAAVAAVALEQREGAFADHVLADEAQDFHAPHWQLLRALVETGPNDLFIAEDAHQRIYGQRVSLKQFGIAIQGRARRLNLNYRTTQQNLRFALGVLAGGEYSAEDELDLEDGATYRSSRTGPAPRTIASATREDEYDDIAGVLREWLDDEHIDASTIALLVRSKPIGVSLQRALEARGLEVRVDARSSTRKAAAPSVLTMHQAKGLEFSRVLLPHLAASQFPAPWALRNVAPEELEEAKLVERSLLYVAASRARDELVVTWAGESSELLPPVVSTGEEGR